MAMSCFRYQRPKELADNPRLTIDIFKSDIVDARVLVLDHSGETRMHSHFDADAVWFVLSGTANFYDENDTVHVLGPHEGAVIPKGTKYWFESSVDEPLEIFRVAGKDTRVTRDTTNLSDMRAIQEVDQANHPHLAIEILDGLPSA